MEETISLNDIVDTLKRRVKLLVILPLLAVLVSALISYFLLTPIYENSTQLLVNQSQQDQVYSQADIRTNVELINTYNVLIKSPAILDKVIEEAGLTDTYTQLNERISVGSEGDSQVVTIKAQHPNPGIAAQIANTTASVFQREVVTLMNVDNVSILAEAQVSDNPSPIAPNPTLNMMIAFVVGLMLAVGLAFLLEFLDKTIKTEKDIDELGLPLLGTVAKMEEIKPEDKNVVLMQGGRESGSSTSRKSQHAETVDY